MKRALVISGGGSKGAYAVGILKKYFELGIKYDIVVGTSTGALIAPFAMNGNIDKLEEAYTNINHSDIFNINPFKIKYKKDGSYTWDINKLSIFYNRYLLKRASFGSTETLRYKTIPSFFSKEDFYSIIDSNKDLCLCISNITLNAAEVKNIKECSYERFCDYMWASTCAPPIMSVPRIGEYQYVDGGITKPIPIDEAILRGADVIDVIVLTTKHQNISFNKTIKSDTHLQLITSNMLLDRLMQYDLNLANLTDIANKNIRINLHFTERKLTENSLIFNKREMKQWVEEGYKYCEDNKKESYILFGNINKYIRLNRRHKLLRNSRFEFKI